MSELASAWAWGPYRKGFGRTPYDHYRIKFAVLALKKELGTLGYQGMELESPIFGGGLDENVRRFQRENGLVVDGLAGRQTCNKLWSFRIAKHAIPNDWLRAQVHWESGDDPGAEFTNGDGSVDRGLCQLNSEQKPATQAQAFDPLWSITYLAQYLRDGAKMHEDCLVDQWRLAVGRWRAPAGADEWCNHPETVPSKDEDASWAEKVAYYVMRVDTDGRKNWAP